MSRLLWVCLGGAIGTGARYLITLWLPGPRATLLVNALGSFLMAAIMHAGLRPPATQASTLVVVLATGVMGGFTTYSAFNYETTRYLRDGALALALGNVAATLVVCLVAGALGLLVARWTLGG